MTPKTLYTTLAFTAAGAALVVLVTVGGDAPRAHADHAPRPPGPVGESGPTTVLLPADELRTASLDVPADVVPGRRDAEAWRVDLDGAAGAQAADAQAAPEPPAVDDGMTRDERWHLVLMDRTASLDDKIQALDGLRFLETADGSDARSDADFEEAMWMLQAATDDVQRQRILKALKGAERGELIDDLTRLLQRDPAPRVRGEAAEVLEEYLGDERAASALRRARDEDPHPKVRERCAEILGG